MGVGAPRRRCDERRLPRGGAYGAACRGGVAYGSGARVDDDAGRRTLRNQVYRPGALIMANARMIPPAFQMDGRLRTWGWFEQGSPPMIEVSARTLGDVFLAGFLKVVRKDTGGASSSGYRGREDARWG